mmetsp:Transcript_28875/g.79259  ORF Transcript_28875/g.79259 Transcript_28875/m.79259 type:complete len:290 (+) Transcript_28875:116-985(+)
MAASSQWNRKTETARVVLYCCVLISISTTLAFQANNPFRSRPSPPLISTVDEESAITAPTVAARRHGSKVGLYSYKQQHDTLTSSRTSRFVRMLRFQGRRRPVSSPQRVSTAAPSGATTEASLKTSRSNKEEEEEEELEYLTPSQVRLLRKEAAKRQARRTLPRVAFPEESDSPLTPITDEFRHDELVLVTGLSKSNKKEVKAVAEELEYELMLEMQKEVFCVTIKGSTATFYAPFDDENDDDPTNESHNNKRAKKIVLRNSYQPNQWSKRIKASRDHRGQIVKEEPQQ